MKSLSIILGTLLCASMPIFSQNISCTELLDYVESEGMSKGSVSSMALYDSSWLGEVKAYTIEGNVAVVAKIKKNDWDLYGKKYVFCGLPSSNWEAFYYGSYDYGKTYGERFHKYIMDYVCECY